MPNIIVYLVGFSGVGKLTIARELATVLKAKVVDNHWVNNPILGLLDNDRTTPFPPTVWGVIARVREAVLETIATICPSHDSFVLTHSGNNEGQADRAIYEAIFRAAERRNALFIPVRLLCDEAEHSRRIVSPERALRLKSMSMLEVADAHRNHVTLRSDHPNEMTLDVSKISSRESATRILSHIKNLRSAGPK